MKNWSEPLRRIAAGEDVQAVLDEVAQRDRADFDRYLRHDLGRPDLADEHAATLREIDMGIYGARGTWSALSHAQRRTLIGAIANGGRLDQIGKAYVPWVEHSPFRPVYAATIRALCTRDLMAWDGGAFDPEAAAVVTERGRFVVQHGPDA